MKLQNWHINFDLDVSSWALPLGFDIYSVNSWRVQILCVDIRVQIYEAIEVSPEEELKQLNEYADEQIRFIAEEREEIMERIGTTTR